MKKIYLTICLGAFIIIASVLLFPVTAHSQDLTEEKKKERCQNNKNRIAELEAQLRVIDAELSQTMEKKEMEDARNHMVFVNIFINSNKNENIDPLDKSNPDFKDIERIGAHYNWDFEKCIYQGFRQGEKPSYVPKICYSDLKKIIAKKIDKAVSLDRPTLLAKKKETEKQLAAHRNNLIALRCDQPMDKKEIDNSDYSKLSGYWELELGSPYGGTTQLAVTNGVVSGSSQRSATAVIKITGGSYDAATKRLSITYIQEWSKKTGKANFDFRESSTNYILTGTWRDDVSGSGNWVMTKKKQ